MNTLSDDHPLLTSEEEALVQRIGEAYAASAMTSARRQAFQARLDERLAGPRRPGRRPWLVLAPAALAALAWLLLARTPLEHAGPVTNLPVSGVQEAQTRAADRELDEALLVMVNGSTTEQDQALPQTLPEDYEAIETFFLEG